MSNSKAANKAAKEPKNSKVKTKTARLKTQATNATTKPKSIKLADYLYCADCHKKLWYHTNVKNMKNHFFSSSNYVKDYRGTCPTRHYIRADSIEQVVMLELRRLAEFLTDDEDTFIEILTKKTNGDIIKQQKHLEEEINKAVAKNDKVAERYENLYEDHADGKVTEEWFMHMSQKFETERLELKNKIRDLRKRLDEADDLRLGQESFVKAIRRFLQMQMLTRPLLQELIDHIDVYETEGVGKNRTQRVVIYYRFVGYIEIPEVPKHRHDNFKADTRQGVSVEYLPRLETA